MLGHRSAATVAIAVIVTAAVSTAGCSGSSSSPGSTVQTPEVSQTTTTQSSADSAATGLAVPGIPDPCALVPVADMLKAAHLDANSKAGAVPAAGGGRSCTFNPGHPDSVTIALTPVSKAGFDAFRQIAHGTVTDLPGLGDEAYRTSQTPSVVDVYKNGFDLNVYVSHVDSAASASGDAKAVAALVVPKL
jgi:hypothetical protein